MSHFSTDNTNGYSEAQLARANEIIDALGLDPVEQSDEYKHEWEQALVQVERELFAQLEALRSKAAAAGDTSIVSIIDDVLKSDCELEKSEALEQCATRLQAASDTKKVLFTCWGSVRGGCDITHKSEAAAAKCLSRDQNRCLRNRGYSDRHMRQIDDPSALADYDVTRGPGRAVESDDDGGELPTIVIVASNPTGSGPLGDADHTDDGMDVDIVIWVAGVAHRGSVTLAKDRHGNWSQWGDDDCWIEDTLLPVVRKYELHGDVAGEAEEIANKS